VATPAFVLAAVAWILAFRVQRFWLDWGLPAAMFWLALELQHVLERSRRAEGRRRLWIALGAAAVFVLAFTSDRGSRWSKYAAMRVAGIELESNRDWLPQPGGILYGDRIQYFYDLFFRFPTAPWRYQVGFEPALMPPADLAIFRAILVEGSSDDALRPWAERLRPADRLLIQRTGPVPKLPSLEWRSLAGGYWLGRTERGDGYGDRSGAAPAAEGASDPGEPAAEVEESPEL
jgi:hypothetical protein